MQLIPVSVTSSRFDSDNGNPFRARDPPEEANVAQGRILPILDAVHDDIESRESESLRHEMERVRALGADFGTEAAQHVVPTSQEEDCPTRAKVGTLGDLTSAEELRGSLSQVERGFASSLQQHLWSQGWRNTSPEYEVFSTAAVQSFQNQLDRAKKAANADRFGTSAFGQLTPQSSAGARDFTVSQVIHPHRHLGPHTNFPTQTEDR